MSSPSIDSFAGVVEDCLISGLVISMISASPMSAKVDMGRDVVDRVAVVEICTYSVYRISKRMDYCKPLIKHIE
jgi:hypothetical protein